MTAAYNGATTIIAKAAIRYRRAAANWRRGRVSVRNRWFRTMWPFRTSWRFETTWQFRTAGSPHNLSVDTAAEPLK